MYFNESNIRLSEQHRKELEREAAQQRQAKASQNRPTQRQTEKKQSPLWTRVWTLL